MAASPWPPSGLDLRSWSAYLYAVYPLDQLPPGCGGPDPPIDPVPPPDIPTTGTLAYRPIEPPPGYAPDCDPMQPLIALALPYLGDLTCLNFVTGENIPAEQTPLATFATTLYVEQITYRTSPGQRQSSISAGSGGLQSFSAGPYSESYFGPSEQKFNATLLDPDPLLNSMLMALITPECLEARQALAEGTFPPAYATQEIDWTWPPGWPTTGIPGWWPSGGCC